MFYYICSCISHMCNYLCACQVNPGIMITHTESCTERGLGCLGAAHM